MFSSPGTSWGRFKKLSTSRAVTTNSKVNKPKKIAPIGVKVFRNFRLPVTTAYKKSTHLVFKLAYLSFFALLIAKFYALVMLPSYFFESLLPDQDATCDVQIDIAETALPLQSG